jgi:hypothetical protein
MEGWRYKGAFVIQFRTDTDIEAGRIIGRVEHVASSRSTRFESLDELLRFIHTVLSELKKTNDFDYPAP